MKLLEGGRTGQIWRDGDTVIRPSGAWTPTVHRFLRHLRSRGFSGAPDPIEITGNQEVISYVAGRVCEDLSDQFVGSEPMVQQSTAASDSLAQEAQKLRELIAQFKLDDVATSHSSALRSTARTMAQPAARAAVHAVAARR